MKVGAKVVSGIALFISSAFTITQTNELFQLISIGITILSGLVVLITNIISWFRKSKADGKITLDEYEEGLRQFNDDLNSIKKEVEATRKEKEDE